jgi:endonuclease YncB( thermonuclease family)
MSLPTVDFQFKRSLRSPTPKSLIQISDGDTPVIRQPIRMVSCDTPEKAHYAGGPDKAQPKLDTCRQRLQSGFYSDLPQGLIDYLAQRLTNHAAADHIEAANEASLEFDKLLNTRLLKDNGSVRKVAVIPTGEIVDRYGRMLSYLAPWYSGSSSDPLPPKGDPRRDTFNLNMVENGWAAFFPIYPSLPQNDDFNRAIAAAAEAWQKKRGVWKKYGRKCLLAYEFRMCIKLGTAKTQKAGMSQAFQRVCVDLRNLRIRGKYDFYKVTPCYRMWVWEEGLAQAKEDLGLIA